MELIFLPLHRHGFKTGSTTRSGNAFAAVQPKAGSMRRTDEITVLHQEFAGCIIQSAACMGANIEPGLNIFLITIKQDRFIFAVNVGIYDDYLPVRQVFA